MRRWVFLLSFLLTSTPSLAGNWVRLDPATLRFSGEIVAGDLEGLRAAFHVGTDTIVVDSPGGLTTEGIQIGRFLAGKKFTVIVDGICMSSCANYIFAAATKKVIRNGVVGFHGDMIAFLTNLDREIESMKELGAKLGEDWSDNIVKVMRVSMELPDDASAAETRAQYRNFKAAAEDERALFLGLGISQDFFERTERSDKGMGKGLTYSMLLPSPETFLRYGFKEIEGVQSKDMVEHDPRFVAYAEQGWPVALD